MISAQKAYFDSGKTIDIGFRIRQLKKLHSALEKYEKHIFQSLKTDFRKSAFETFGTEIYLVRKETEYFLKHLPKLARPERVHTLISSFPSANYIYHEPRGVVLIIGAWNYPLQLVLTPLVGAIAAGNCAVIKPSELAIHTSAIIRTIVEENFLDSYISVVEGGPEISQSLLKEHFDYIFFTGSEKTGRLVYEAAAKNLIPCTLELGGKSPCIIDEDANIPLAAKKIVWGKFLNGGQTCVAPDYLLVHTKKTELLKKKLTYYIKRFYGENPQESTDFPRIINKKHFERLSGLLQNGQIICGGQTDEKELFIAPTILEKITWEDPVMKEEIFGPILPILTFDNLDDLITLLKQKPKPLALYYFSSSRKKQKMIIRKLQFGGGCINDTLLQFGSPHLPVGGVGRSGIGKYHGKASFDTFSNKKSIIKKRSFLDVPLRYPPYSGMLKWAKLLLRI